MERRLSETRSAGEPVAPGHSDGDDTQASSRPGPVHVFAEADYCYGAGPLTIRVERVDWTRPVWYDDEDWYHVHGLEIDHRGAERGPRWVLVRGRRLPSATRPPQT